MAKSKKTAVISIKGLNNRDTSIKRDDGYCKTLHNMTYRNGCWRGVCGLSVKETITSNPDQFRIIYKHPILGENEYIAYRRTKSEYWKIDFSYVRIVDGAVREVQKMFTMSSTVDMKDVRISHYGAVIYFSIKQGDDIFEQSQIFFRGAYVDFNLKQIPPVSTIGVDITSVRSAYDQTKTPAARIAQITVRPSTIITGDVTIDTFQPDYREIYDSFAAQGYITGSVAVFAAYKMYDGTVVRNGDVQLLMPYKRSTDQGERLYRNIEENRYSYYMDLYGYTAKLLLGTNGDAVKDIPFIDSIVVYACRPESMYDLDAIFTLYDKNHPKKGSISVNGKVFERVRADSLIRKENYSLLRKPFYKIGEVNFRNGETSLMLNDFVFRNIEDKEMYQPNFSAHTTISAGIFDYNGYLHRFSLKTFLYQGWMYVVESPSVSIDNIKYVRNTDSGGYKTVFVYTLSVDGRDVNVKVGRNTASYKRQYAPTEESSYIFIPNFITYPDARAYKVSIYISQNDSANHLLAEYPMEPAYGNNYAYYHKTDGELISAYIMIPFGNLIFTYSLPARTEYVMGKNQMVVSDKPNPYSFAPADIYSVGDSFSTEIVDMNIPADEISDARFGEFPVYLFTTTGIFALELGGTESVYKTSFMINNDGIKSGSRTLVRSGSLYYMSGNKVCSLQGRMGVNLSEMMMGGESGAEFGEYVSGALLYVHDPYNELIVYNRDYNYAYVYSVEAGAWSTRDFSGVPAGGTLLLNGDLLYDLSEGENETDLLPSTVVLGELRLGNDSSKVAEQIKIDYSGKDVSGSVRVRNSASQRCVGRFKDKSRLRRVQGSWRTMEIELEGKIDYLNGLVLDYYLMYEK